MKHPLPARGNARPVPGHEIAAWAALAAVLFLAFCGCSGQRERELEQRAQLERRLERRMAEVDSAVDSLYAGFNRSGAKTRARAGHYLRDLRNRQDEARQEFRELRRSGEGAWKDFRDRFQVAFARVEKAYEHAKESFENERPRGTDQQSPSRTDSTGRRP